MSCQIRSIASISEVDEIKRYLFPNDEKKSTETWLQQCLLSVCPTGDLIAVARERRLVLLTSRWDNTTSSSQFQMKFSGFVHDVENIKAVLCLPIVGLTKSSHVSPDWTCIILGFDSGFIRIYMESCELLYEEQFHNESITSIKCQSQHSPRPDISLDLNLEEIYIQYQSNICVISGNHLFPLLRSYRAQLARVQANSELLEITQANVSVRKWGFQDQSVINDVVVVGLTISSAFDHLLNASTCGGFDSKFRSMPPNNTLVLAAGSKPFLGFHYAIEGGAQPVLSDVAKAVAHKLKNALPSWLTGNNPQLEKRPSVSLQPAEQMGCRFGLCDLHRTANSIILSPNHKLATISDSLGRVILIDTEKGVALRILKGYRDAQCSFIQVPDERRSKFKIGDKVALFLIIYAPKKGTIEIFNCQQCMKICTFSASKYSRLLYINYSLMGFSQPSKSKYICQFNTIFIDNDGQIKEILIPFHYALGEKSNKRARDIHLYKKLKQLIKCENCDNETLLTETVNVIKEMKTVELKTQLMEMLSTSKNIPFESLLKFAQELIDGLENDETSNNSFKIKLENIKSVLEFYLYLSKEDEFENEGTPIIVMKLEGKEKNNLQKLLDLNAINDNKPNELKVTFSKNESFSTSEILSVFDLTSLNINLLPNQDENVLYRVSEALFQNYIKSKQASCNFQKEVEKSRISIKDLFFLLITYWVNRPLDVELNLSNEMENLTNILYIFAKISNPCENFWNEIRIILENSNRPFPALTAAMLCKYVAYKIEREDLEQASDDETFEIWSEDNIEWTLLIGKLEDVSLLNILTSTKPVIERNCTLPKLRHEKIDVSLKYVLQRKGSVSEVVARWLTMTGIDPEYIVINDKINQLYGKNCEEISEENDTETYPEDRIQFVKTEVVFEYFNMIRTQWPYSLEAGMILSNMAWEYALEWKKAVQNFNNLEACISCLKQIPNFHVRLGLFNLVWKIHMKFLFETTIKLLNKVGKVPKERLCKQDTELSDLQIPIFIKICTNFLDTFTDIVQEMYNVPKSPLNFEPVWENDGQPLAELAVQQTNINYDLLLVHYQLSLVFEMLCTFSIKSSKPMNNLFDSEVVNVLFHDLHEKPDVDYSRTDSKLKSTRIQFLNVVISSSIEAITVKDDVIFAKNHVFWMSRCTLLGTIWDLDVDVLRKHQVVQLFTHGYNILAQDLSGSVRNRNEFGVELLSLAGKRMSKYVAASADLGTQLAALTPTVTRFMDSLNGEWCAESTLKDVIDLTTLSITCFDENQQEYKLAMMLLEACTTLKNLDETN